MENSDLVVPLITAGVGLVTFVVGQFIIKLIVEPVQQHRLLMGEIAAALVFYAYRFSNPGLGPSPDSSKAQDELRGLASALCARTHAITPKWLCVLTGLIPPIKDCRSAASALIGLSNGVSISQVEMMFQLIEANEKRKTDVKRLLKIETLI